MGAVVMLVRSELQRRWRSLVVVALLVGFAGGVTLAAVAGARRTSSSFDRFLASSRNQHVIVFADDARPADVERLRSLPGVAAIAYARQLALIQPDGEFLAVGGPLDDVLFRDVNRLRIVEGREPAAGAADEVVVGEPLARANRLRVGDRLRLDSYSQEDFGQVVQGAEPDPSGPELRLRVVGISRAPVDLSLQGTAGGILLLPRAFVERYGDEIGNFSGEHGAVLLARLTDGEAGIPRFLDQLRRVLGERSFDVDPTALTVGGVQESIDLLAVAMLVFAAIAGVAGAIGVGMTTSRQVAALADGQAAVLDLGLPRPQRAAAVAGPVLLVVGAGALLAVVAAWAASPLLPLGVAREAEPDPGLHFDVFVLGAGAVVIAGVLAGIVAVASWRATRGRTAAAAAPLRPSVVTRSLEGIGLAPPATVGVRMALEPGRGRTAVPVRSSLVGAALAVLGVVAVAVFASSLDRLLGTPAAFGRPWDVQVIDARAQVEQEGRICGRAETRLVDDPAVGAIAVACNLNITVNGRAIGAFGITPLRGAMDPTVLDGRAPRRRDEVALGTDTLKALGLEVGDRVRARTPAGTASYRVVGRIVVPALSDPQAVADGAVFTGAALDRLDAPDDNFGSSDLVVRFRPGVDETAAAARIRRLPDIGYFGQSGVRRAAIPLEVERLEQIDRIPVALAVFLAVLGAVAIGHLLVMSVRRRRRDFAVLKAVGFRRRQLLACVGWQATTVAAFALVVGLVLGIAAGAGLWRAAAESVGLVPEVDTSVLVLGAIALASVAIVNLVAAFPARTAARTPAATVLRSE